MAQMPGSSSRRGPGRPPKSTRGRRSTRDKLLDVAAQAFSDHGYQATTVEEVLRRAELSKGTFYHHFTGKDELFSAVVEERLDRPARELMQITARAPAGETTSAAVSEGLSKLVASERSLVLLLEEFRVQAARDRKLAARWRARQALLRESLAEALRQRHETTGVPLTFDAERLAEGLLVLAQGLGVEAILDPKAVDPTLYGQLLALFYDGLAARARGR